MAKIARRRAKQSAHPPGALTRTRLTDAAETLFAEKGFSGVSMREIVRKAGVNVAAAHYHFGCKEQLFEAVFSRAAEPVKEETIRMLAELENAKPGPELLDHVIRAFIVPSFSVVRNSGKAASRYSKLRAHLFLEDRAFAHKVFKKFYAEVTQRTVEALRRALPRLSRRELAWRCHIMVATLVFSTIPAGRVHPFSEQAYRPDNADESVAFLVPLLAAVFRAPAVEAKPRPARLSSVPGSLDGKRSRVRSLV